MLERMEPQRNHRGSGFGLPDAKNSTLLTELVVIERISGEHRASRRGGLLRRI
jgi:hypothetical protein